MNRQDFQVWLIPIAIVGFFIWRFLKFKRVKSDLPALLRAGAIVVDVRSPSEFQQGSRPASLNIPLSEIKFRMKELDKSKPIILCCASGARSGMAAGILRKNGYGLVVNAGPWKNTLN
jgi:rhodanese-related sulfurtransferase